MTMSFKPQFFEKLLRNMQKYQKQRIKIISLSSEVLRNSKQAIFATHRDEIKEAKKCLETAENRLNQIQKMLQENYSLEQEGSFKAGVEEYVEARFFLDYLQGKKIEFVNKYRIGMEEYLSGLADFTGELVRRSVLRATRRDDKEVEKHRTTLEIVVAELVQYNLTGKLRQKFDEAKRNLKRVEEILYDLNIRK